MTGFQCQQEFWLLLLRPSIKPDWKLFNIVATLKYYPDTITKQLPDSFLLTLSNHKIVYGTINTGVKLLLTFLP